MGKKRRYIQRANKFSKKAFNFLDKLDGNAADGDLESSKIDTHISRIVVTDRGNQTMSFIARCHGPGDGSNNLQNDHVIYTIDGTAVHGDGVITINHAGSGRDKNTASSAAPASSRTRPRWARPAAPPTRSRASALGARAGAHSRASLSRLAPCSHLASVPARSRTRPPLPMAARPSPSTRQPLPGATSCGSRPRAPL